MEYMQAITREFILDLFKKSDALLTGHFKLSSGLHSNTYLQCAKVLQYPDMNALLSSMIAKKFKDHNIDVVVGPAIGGITLSYGLAEKLHCRSIFAERVTKDDQRVMSLRRGFDIQPGEKVVVVEDVITTGGSVKEVIDLVQELKGDLIGVAGIVDRSNGKIKLHDNQHFLLQVEPEKYEPEMCPLCKENVPIDSPGSKFV